MLKRQCHEKEKVVDEACSAIYEFCGLGSALPLSVPSGFFTRAEGNNGTDPPQFGGGLSENVCVQMMGKALCPMMVAIGDSVTSILETLPQKDCPPTCITKDWTYK